MSQENIDLGNRLVAAVSSGALSDALAVELLTPDFARRREGLKAADLEK